MKPRRQAPLPEPVPGKAVLTRAEAAKQRGASAADIEAVAGSLSGYGLTVLSKDTATRSVKLSGSVERMETVFKIHDHLYRGRVDDLSVPAELRGIVEGVFGLDTMPMIRQRLQQTQQPSISCAPICCGWRPTRGPRRCPAGSGINPTTLPTKIVGMILVDPETELVS